MRWRSLVAVATGVIFWPGSLRADLATAFGWGPNLPATCASPALWLDTDAPTGHRLYACESGTFKLQGGSSGLTKTSNVIHPTTATDDFGDDASQSDWSISDTGDAAFKSLSIGDQATEPGNKLGVLDNDTAFTNDPTCANSGVAGEVSILDRNETGSDTWVVCDGTAQVWEFSASTTTTHALMATATSGAPAFRALADADMPDSATVAGWDLGSTSVATSPPADDNDTSLATSASVQTEINGAGGAGLACASGSCATASTEQAFLAAGELICGPNTNGMAKVHTTPLQYCDNAATPALQYAAYGASDGDALAGDNATAFFSGGTLEVGIGGSGASSFTDGGILLGNDTGAFVALGVAANGQIPIGDGTTDPVLATISGTTNEIEIGNGAGTITVGIPTSPTLDGTNFSSIPTSALTTEVRSMYWGAGSFSVDGTNCTTPVESTAMLVKQYKVSCANSDAAIFYGSTVMPPGWNGGTVIFQLEIGQVTASTNGIEIDFAAQCVSHDEALAAFGTPPTGEQPAAITLTADNDMLSDETPAITVAGTSCAGGDALFWTGQVDATASHADIATAVEILGVRMEFTTNVGD